MFLAPSASLVKHVGTGEGNCNQAVDIVILRVPERVSIVSLQSRLL